tara:strand:+ start:309 stop:620 length:312 start_codon:yes stop_codon:yes gene_type:complete
MTSFYTRVRFVGNKLAETNVLRTSRRHGQQSPRRSRGQHACAPSDPELHGLRQYPDDPKVLAQPHWQGRFTPRDYEALTPLIWEHVNSYGRFELDMNVRLALL